MWRWPETIKKAITPKTWLISSWSLGIAPSIPLLRVRDVQGETSTSHIDMLPISLKWVTMQAMTDNTMVMPFPEMDCFDTYRKVHNKHTMAVTIHTCDGGSGWWNSCDGNGCQTYTYNANSNLMCPEDRCIINTNRPFTVSHFQNSDMVKTTFPLFLSCITQPQGFLC